MDDSMALRLEVVCVLFNPTIKSRRNADDLRRTR